MAQTAALIEALKKALKAHGKTYADVAAALQLSTPSVKRLFAEQTLSLQRLDSICALLNMEITDLLQQLAEDGWHLQQLSDEQEREIAGDMLLLLVTVSVLNRLQLGTDAGSVPLSLGAADFTLGIIAGTRSLEPHLARYLPRPNDGKVSVNSTRLTGMTDFIELPVSHTFMMGNREVLAQVRAFLRDGRFDHRVNGTH